MSVAILGASNKPHRYSYQALKLLLEKGYKVYPVHPRVRDIEGTHVYSCLGEIQESIDTVTLYVGPAVSTQMADDILSIQPRRIIFKPGAENDELERLAKEKGIETIKGCTLVMLRTKQF